MGRSEEGMSIANDEANATRLRKRMSTRPAACSIVRISSLVTLSLHMASVAGLAGADADHVGQLGDEYLAVAHLAGLGGAP